MPVTLGGQSGGTPPLLNNSEEFTSSGTFTVPAGVTSVLVTMIGGGGAGGGGRNTATLGFSGGGGGSGALAYYNLPVEVTPGANITVTIGAGGAGVSAANGNAGNNTQFGDIVALGGLGGFLGGSSVGGAGAAQGRTRYAIGNTQYEYEALGDYKYPSSNGAQGFDDGASAPSFVFYSPLLGYMTSANLVWTPSGAGNGGHGGMSIFGYGGVAGAGFENGNAPAAGAYGAGGGGAGHLSTGSGGGATTGGDGADGYVVVRWV